MTSGLLPFGEGGRFLGLISRVFICRSAKILRACNSANFERALIRYPAIAAAKEIARYEESSFTR